MAEHPHQAHSDQQYFPKENNFPSLSTNKCLARLLLIYLFLENFLLKMVTIKQELVRQIKHLNSLAFRRKKEKNEAFKLHIKLIHSSINNQVLPMVFENSYPSMVSHPFDDSRLGMLKKKLLTLQKLSISYRITSVYAIFF